MGSTFYPGISKRQSLLRAVCDEYSKSARKYHNIKHVSSMITALHALLGSNRPISSKLLSMRPLLFSIVFHDIIYYPSFRFNEESSCVAFLNFALAWNMSYVQDLCKEISNNRRNTANNPHFAKREILNESHKLHICPGEARVVLRAIMQTKHTSNHKIRYIDNAVSSFTCKLLSDLDLSILGSSWKKYVAYKDQIRTEYSHIPLSVYNKARVNVLKKFLQQKVIYRLPEIRARWESRAEINIKREIKLLSVG